MAFIDKDNLTIVRRKKKEVKNVEASVVSRLRVYVEAGEAKPVAPLSGVLGQFGINAMEFCKKFNEISKIYENELPILVLIVKKSDGSMNINIKGPSLAFLLWVLLDEGELVECSIVEIYDLVKLMSRKFSEYNLQHVACFVFGTLLSNKFKINILL